MITPNTHTQSDPYRLANGIRETLLKLGYGKALLVIECLYALNFSGDTWLTEKEIFRLLRDNFGTSFRIVYEALRHHLLFQRRKSEGVAYRRGPRPYLYRLPYPEELKAEFAPEIKVTPHDELRRADLRNMKTYCLGLHREFVTRLWLNNNGQGVEMYREFQAERLNRSVRTIRTYDKALNFSYEANYIKRPITADNWNDLPRYKNKYDASGKRLPSRKWLETYDRRSAERKTLPFVRYLAYSALNEGLEVCEVERTANTYYPYQKPDKSQFESTWSAEYYYADMEARAAAGLYYRADGTWYYRRE